MNFYLAIVLRATAALVATLALTVGLGKLVETGDVFWLAPAALSAALAYALWRLAQHVMLRHVESREVPFSL